MTNIKAANLISSTMTADNFSGVNLDGLKNVLIEKCLSKLADGYELESGIKHEFENELHYIYFTALPTKEGYNKQMHRYYKMVFSMLFFENYYFDSNVIDLSHNYTIQDVKNSFKCLLRHLTSLTNTI